MDKQAHIDYWVTSAKDDEDTMHYLYNGQKYVHALFFGHLMIEKLFKALLVKNHISNVAPKTLSIDRLLKRLDIIMDSEQLELIKKLFLFRSQVSCPNPKITLDKNFDKNYVQRIETLKLSLLNKLQ